MGIRPSYFFCLYPSLILRNLQPFETVRSMLDNEQPMDVRISVALSEPAGVGGAAEERHVRLARRAVAQPRGGRAQEAAGVRRPR